jgi:hypothetical protein
MVYLRKQTQALELTFTALRQHLKVFSVGVQSISFSLDSKSVPYSEYAFPPFSRCISVSIFEASTHPTVARLCAATS